MASMEQCRQRLRERLKSRTDVVAFVKQWGGDYSEPKGASEEAIVSENIERIIQQAFKGGKLDVLGTRLGLPSDAEQARRDAQGAALRSWVAIVVSVLALLVSIAVATWK